MILNHLTDYVAILNWVAVIIVVLLRSNYYGYWGMYFYTEYNTPYYVSTGINTKLGAKAVDLHQSNPELSNK